MYLSFLRYGCNKKYIFGYWISINRQATVVKDVVNTSTVVEEAVSDKESLTFLADPYERWNTYRDEACGFSFRYPSDWIVEENLMGRGEMLVSPRKHRGA